MGFRITHNLIFLVMVMVCCYGNCLSSKSNKKGDEKPFEEVGDSNLFGLSVDNAISKPDSDTIYAKSYTKIWLPIVKKRSANNHKESGRIKTNANNFAKSSSTSGDFQDIPVGHHFGNEHKWRKERKTNSKSSSFFEDDNSSDGCRCWNATAHAGGVEDECKCTVWDQLIGAPPDLSPSVKRLTISDSEVRFVKRNSMEKFKETLQDLVFVGNRNLESIQDGSFEMLKNLRSISILNAEKLLRLPGFQFANNLRFLRSIRVMGSGLREIPVIETTSKQDIFHLIEFEGNRIEAIQSRTFKVKTEQLVLNFNLIASVAENAFAGSHIGKLSLKGNRRLQRIHPKAFAGIQTIRAVDLSETSITYLPTEGLEEIEELWLEDVPTLKVFPSVYSFTSIHRAHLTYTYHCCAFRFPKQHYSASTADSAYQLSFQEEQLLLKRQQCSDEATVQNDHPRFNRQVQNDPDKPESLKKPEHDPLQYENSEEKMNTVAGRRLSRALKINSYWGRLHPTNHRLGGHSAQNGPFFSSSFGHFNDSAKVDEITGNYNFNTIVDVTHFGEGMFDGDFPTEKSITPTTRSEHGIFHTDITTVKNYTMEVVCGNFSKNYRDVTCSPLPDAFNPCEDIMGMVVLRVGVWVVVVTAVVGNFFVMVVLLSSRFRMTVSKFLMVNLATADLCMGIYLLIIGAMDLRSMGSYFNFAIDWQNGFGCQVAGFLTVFSSELSIFTLTVITSERWYAITYAIHLNKRLRLPLAAKIMLVGWLYSLFMAALPLCGISSYSKTSICLPMEAKGDLAMVYLITLLVLNGLAFAIITGCYVSMYWSISRRGATATATKSDLKVAKRMALLVFTDFACWAPIAFFGLTAVAGAPLIGVSNAKILLVTFYPLNSCANPYLYAILTRQYRRDLFILLERYGFCTQRALKYKVAYSSVNNTHPQNPLASSCAAPQHRSSTLTQVTLCDLSRLARSSMHSGVGDIAVLEDSLVTNPSLLRGPHANDPDTERIPDVTDVSDIRQVAETSLDENVPECKRNVSRKRLRELKRQYKKRTTQGTSERP